MLDQQLVRSGFDVEILLGEGQLGHVILALIDAGTILTTFAIGDPPKHVQLRGPSTIDRTYEPFADAALPRPVGPALHPCEVELLFGQAADVRVHIVADISELTAPLLLDAVEVDLFIALALQTDRDPAGALTSARLDVALLDFASELDGSLAQLGVDKATILATLQAAVNRQVDLGGVGAFKRIQDLAFRKLDADGDHPRALGLYVNLRLQDGPEPDSLVSARGSLDDARNFLPAGSDAAMASRAGLYGALANDAFQRFAELDASGHASYPWHKSLYNKKSKVIGKIKGVSAAPIPNTHTLRIDVTVEYEIDNFFDPDAHLILELTPITNDQGVLAWHVDADFHASVLLELIGFLALASLFTGVGAIVGLSLGAAIAGGLITGALVDKLGHFVVDEVYGGRVEAKVNAGLPDVVSARVEVAQRRWDPLYTTHHQVAMRPDGILVTGDGVALWGRAVLDKQVVALADAVIRDKLVQSPDPPTALRYRVADASDVRADFTAVAPGTDRRDFTQHDPVGEPTLFQLTIAQVVARLVEQRIVPDLAYLARRVDIRQHQAHGILTISNREYNEQRDDLIGRFEGFVGAALDRAQGDSAQLAAELAAQGVTLAPDQLEQVLGGAVQPAIDAFIAGPLGARLEAALVPLLRFDLPPENLAALQQQGILHLLDLELITRRDGVRYYRDHPDFYEPDNLLALPHYHQTPDGPKVP